MADNNAKPKQGDKKNNYQPKPKPIFRGLVAELPMLHYNPRENMSLSLTSFFERFRVYVRKNYFEDLDNIFDPVDPQYPEIEQAAVDAQVLAIQGEAIANIQFSTDFKIQRSKEVRLEEDKKKVHGLILGQLSNASKEQLRTTADGNEAMEQKDPLNLVTEIRNTHLLVDRTQPELNFDTANNKYANLRGEDRESLSSYKRRLEAAVAQLRDAAERAGADYVVRLPNDQMIVTRFIKGLAPKYGAYAQKIDRQEKEIPANLQLAYDDVIAHGEEYAYRNDHQHRAYNVFAAYTGRGGRDGGRGRGGRGHGGRGGAAEIVPGLDGQVFPNAKCFFRKCGKRGHYMRECPIRQEYNGNKKARDDDHAVEKAVKTATAASK